MAATVVETSREECVKQAAQTIAEKIRSIATNKPHVILGLTTGVEIEDVYKHLLHQDAPWKKVHIFMVDERCVSLNSLQSNYRSLSSTFIEPLIKEKKLPEANAHPFIYNSINAIGGIKKYDTEFSHHNRKFDLIVLNAGTDGHVAALFPAHRSVINEAAGFFLMDDAPQPPPKRMTASRNLLSKSQTGFLFFLGKGKKEAWRRFNDEMYDIKKCPAKLIKELAESYVFYEVE